MVDREGVHETHCCILHGCKYGDDDCPVALNEIEQKYTCEFCDDDGFKTVANVREFSLSDVELPETLWETYVLVRNLEEVNKIARKALELQKQLGGKKKHPKTGII